MKSSNFNNLSIFWKIYGQSLFQNSERSLLDILSPRSDWVDSYDEAFHTMYMLNPFRYQIETACLCHHEKYHQTLSRPHPNRVRHFRCASWYGDAIYIRFLGLFCVCISYIAGNWVPHTYTSNMGNHIIALKYTIPSLYILGILQDTRTDCLNIVNNDSIFLVSLRSC